jgi:hypothetical protein
MNTNFRIFNDPFLQPLSRKKMLEINVTWGVKCFCVKFTFLIKIMFIMSSVKVINTLFYILLTVHLISLITG